VERFSAFARIPNNGEPITTETTEQVQQNVA